MSFDPSESYPKALERAATLWGIVPSFWDIFGTRHFTTPEIAKAILGSMGVPVESKESIDGAVEERLCEDWNRLVPATLVAGNPVTAIALSVPKELAGGVVSWEISTESGSRFVGGYRLTGSQGLEQVELRGRAYLRMMLPIAFDGLGYHTLRLKLENGAQSVKAESRLIVCPDRAWFPPPWWPATPSPQSR